VPTRRLIALSGTAYLAAMILLAVTEAPLGTAGFFACAAVAVASYASMLRVVWRATDDRARWFVLAALFAVAFRVPLAFPPVLNDNDMARYVWDGRVQKLGLNPYALRPADPGLEYTHDDQTRGMPSARHRTPYPPGAQIFFRFVVSIRDSGRAMKVALIVCDLLTMLVLWRWLVTSGRDPSLLFAYAWNPLVVLETAHSGHIDALGALWIASAVFWLSRRRTLLATVAFVLAVTTKLLPIVLVPLLWKRISLRDAFVGAGLVVLLYLPYSTGVDVLFGIQNVVQHIRFNGPVFRFFMAIGSPDIAARVALGAGLLTAVWFRWKASADEPSAWAWPMAAAIAGAPVIYPWYLLYLTPFLLVPATLPLTVWCGSILVTYRVWVLAANGAGWVVPLPLLALEYGVVLVAIGASWFLRHHDPQNDVDQDARESG
jgi:alpha-1,6-mannosyltransferase